jgi:hypothetical protein
VYLASSFTASDSVGASTYQRPSLVTLIKMGRDYEHLSASAPSNTRQNGDEHELPRRPRAVYDEAMRSRGGVDDSTWLHKQSADLLFMMLICPQIRLPSKPCLRTTGSL